MRALSALFIAGLFAVFTAAALADDDDDGPPPPSPPSTDAKFVAYNQPVIAFTHAEIVDGTGGKPRYDQTLIVKDGRLATMGPASRTPVPHGATLIDAHGK